MKHILAISLLSASLFAQTPYPLGMKPSLHGTRGTPIEQHPRFAAAPLPAAADLSAWFYKTDQGDIGSCGPTSVREVYDAAFQKSNRGAHSVISALDLYQRVLIAQGNFPNDEGVSNDVLLSISKRGHLLERTWPYDTSKLGTLPTPSPALNAERLAHQVIKGYVLPTNDKGYAIRQCIANVKIAPIIGTLWYQNGFSVRKVTCSTKDSRGRTVSVTRYVVPAPRGRPVGGHDIPAIAYDMNLRFPTGEVGGVKFKNHWRAWGDPETGSAWAPISWFFNPRYIDDPIALEVVE